MRIAMDPSHATVPFASSRDGQRRPSNKQRPYSQPSKAPAECWLIRSRDLGPRRASLSCSPFSCGHPPQAAATTTTTTATTTFHSGLPAASQPASQPNLLLLHPLDTSSYIPPLHTGCSVHPSFCSRRPPGLIQRQLPSIGTFCTGPPPLPNSIRYVGTLSVHLGPRPPVQGDDGQGRDGGGRSLPPSSPSTRRPLFASELSSFTTPAQPGPSLLGRS